MNDDATNNAGRNSDSSGGRISHDRRLLTNIGIEGKESFDAVLAVAKVLDRASSDSRRAAIFKTIGQLDDLIATIQDTSGLLRDIAARGVFPLEPPRPQEMGRARRAVAWLCFWRSR